MINNLLAKDLFQLHGKNACSTVTGEEGDISNLCQFDWCEWCHFRDHKAEFPFPKESLGQVLGPARGTGNEMCQWVLKNNGQVVARCICRPLTVAEKHSPTEQQKHEIFDNLIGEELGDSINLPKIPFKKNKRQPSDCQQDMNIDFIEHEDDEEAPQLVPDADGDIARDEQGKLIGVNPFSDMMINAEMKLQHQDRMEVARVKNRIHDSDGKVAQVWDNPFSTSTAHDVEFPDGTIKQCAANILAENLLSQVDKGGCAIFDGILDAKKDDTAVSEADRFPVTKRGCRKMRQTTQGWHILVAWKDGAEQ